MNWMSIANNMPPALPGEASFSSSGTCVATQGTSNAWITTGGSDIARILATTDGGNTWAAYNTPLHSWPTAGGFSVAFRDSSNGILGGGDLVPVNISCRRHKWQPRMMADRRGSSPASLRCSMHFWSGLSEQHHRFRRTAAVLNNDSRSSGQPTTRDTWSITADTGGAAWTPDEGTTWYQLPASPDIGRSRSPIRRMAGWWAAAVTS